MLALLKRNLFIIVIFIFTLLLAFLTFLTFIGKSFIELNDNNLQYLLILNFILLIVFFILIFIDIKNSIKNNINIRGSIANRKYIISFGLFTLIPSLLIAIFSLFIFSFALEKYFDQKITSAVNNSYQVAKNYIEESKKSVETDIYLISLDLNRYSEIFFSNPKRFSTIVRAQKNLRKVDEVYLLDSSGSIFLSDTSNPEDQFTTPGEEIFDKTLEGNPVLVGIFIISLPGTIK